jgi:hypothetical protein
MNAATIRPLAHRNAGVIGTVRRFTQFSDNLLAWQNMIRWIRPAAHPWPRVKLVLSDSVAFRDGSDRPREPQVEYGAACPSLSRVRPAPGIRSGPGWPGDRLAIRRGCRDNRPTRARLFGTFIKDSSCP